MLPMRPIVGTTQISVDTISRTDLTPPTRYSSGSRYQDRLRQDGCIDGVSQGQLLGGL